MENVFNVLDWYMANVDKVFPVMFSIFIIGGYIGLSEFFFDDSLGKTILILAPALLLFFLSFTGGAFHQEYYTNLSTALLSAIVGVILVGIANTLDDWGIALGLAALIAFIFVMTSDPAHPQTNFLLNMGTSIVGAFLLARLLRQEWKWSPSGRVDEVWKSIRQTRKERREDREDFGDFFILMMGDEESEIQQRIDFLTDHNMAITKDLPVELDKETGKYYRIIHTNILTVVKDAETLFLNNTEARIRLMAYPDSAKRVYKQLQEVLQMEPPKKLDAESGLMQIEVKAIAPQTLFSDYLETKIFELARTWRSSGDEHLDYAAGALVEWAQSMDFIKE